ncbi:MAG TPA: transglutaminaseTgpA domain-containing protein [Ktedonobacterales bacterium]
MQSITTTRPAGPPSPVPGPSTPPRRNGATPEAGPWWKNRYFLLWPEDGLVTVLLIATVVYITIASIQGVTPAWAPGMPILTPLVLLGLLMGYIAVQQRVVALIIVHTLFVVGGIAAAFWFTARAVLRGDMRLLLVHLGVWVRQVIHNQSSTDNTIFLLFLAMLTYLLGYLSIWLVLHSRRPWLAVLANVTVLLINLNYAPADELIFLVIFLLAALLLLVRFTLAENVRLWRTRRLRFSPDLYWDFLQAGVLFAVAVLLLAYILPVSAPNPTINAILSNPNGAWESFQHRWQSIFGNVNGPGGGSAGLFSGNLQLQGTVNLPNTELFRYTSTDPSEYLITQTFDTYDGHATWSQSLTRTLSYNSGALYPPTTALYRLANQHIDLTNVGNGQQGLFAAGEPASFTMPTNVYVTTTGDVPVAWFSRNDLVSGQQYDAQSYLSTATEDQLRAVQYPAASSPDAYPTSILSLYLDNSSTVISPEVVATGAQWTAGTHTPYEAALAIESQLRTFTYSLSNGTVPANEDAVVWFLHNKRGFCTFFASTMALMMRSLGMPARVATGVTNGTYDTAQHNYVVKGTDLHAWTQVYFAGYGWINFEPTQTFQEFARGSSGALTPGASPTGQTTPGGGRTTPTPRFRQGEQPTGPEGQTSPAGIVLRDVGLALGFLVALLLLVVAGGFVWWRALYRNRPPIEGAFARVARLGAWTGHPAAPDDTPYEYAEGLSRLAPAEASAFQGLSELYVRERWGGVAAPAAETASLYNRARRALLPAIARQWRVVPSWLVRHFVQPLLARMRRMEQRVKRSLDRLLEPPGGW